MTCSKTFYSSVFTVGLGLMNGRKKEKTEHIVTKLKKVQQTKLLDK